MPTDPRADVAARTWRKWRGGGLSSVATGAARNGRLLASFVHHRLMRRTFEFDGQTYPYFIHPYNTTWLNERSVEIPLACEFLARAGLGRGLEVGNVLRHYQKVGHEVIDKYEVSPGVRNLDVVDLPPTPTFDFIVAVSTLEHVGFEEEPHEPQKLLQAVATLRQVLRPDGLMFVTCPMGFNPTLDELIRSARTAPRRQGFLHRDKGSLTWRQLTSDQLPEEPVFDYGGLAGHTLWIAEFTSASQDG